MGSQADVGAAAPAADAFRPLRLAAVAAALAWCAAFPVVGLGGRLHLFGDGALFAYAVAAADSWAFHWRNISGRAFAWLVASAPGEAWTRLARDPAGGVALYAALHFLAPAASLALTAALDRTPGRAVVSWACASTALLLPVVFGYPTEMWIAHAALWPALALLHAPGGRTRDAATVAALAALCLSHEAGVVWATVAVATLALGPHARRRIARGAAALAVALAPWGALKLLVRPDPYVAEVLGRNAANLFDPLELVTPLTVLGTAALASYAAALWGLRRTARPAAGAAALTAAGLALWWGAVDAPLHGWDRYYLRTLLLGAAPLFVVAAGLQASGRLGALAARLPAPRRTAAALTGALALVCLIHAVETARFVRAFAAYRAEVAALAAGVAADPALGDPAFVSAARLSPAHGRLGWHSTTPFLSVMATPGLAPARLAVDPATNYFWFDCAAAARNAAADRALPERTRALVRAYACRHR